MSNEDQSLKPEHMFKKVIWRSTLSLCETMEQGTTWSITGIAAIIGLYLSHLDSVGQLVTRQGVRWSILCFATSLLAGAVSKHIGMAITKGLTMLKEVEATLYSIQGQALINKMTSPSPQLGEEIAEPFLWPLSRMMRDGWLRGMNDHLAADKRFLVLFCTQLYLAWLHWFCAIAGLVVVACSIMTA